MNIEQLDQPLLGADEAPPEHLWETLGVTPHPVALLPDVAYLRTQPVSELLDYLSQREETITRMREDPFNYGHEPRIWRVLDALCGFPWIDHPIATVSAERDARRRAEMETDRAWCRQVRLTLLGKDEALKVLLINGGNRGSKSEWASSRVSKLLHFKQRARAWCFHQDESMSIEYQQPLLYKYLPNELKTEKGIRKGTTYIAYKQQTGFPEARFVLPNGSDCSFRFYEQNVKKIQGGELDIVWCDELVPASWIKELKARIATRGGWLIITFTPVDGYTPTVKMFLDVAKVTKRTTAFVLPKDGKESRPDLALAGEDVDAWFTPGRQSQPAEPEGRQFEKVPRVMVCQDRRTGVFFLHSFDNPFGNPQELWSLYANEPEDRKRMRFYGLAVKAVTSRFPKFNRSVHMLPAAQMPAGGTRYHVVDPCSGRNWFMIWARVRDLPRGKTYFVYREWPTPGRYIPGVGDLGEWAVPGDKHDGDMGPAQRSLGWGLKRYKGEVLRLEGRKDWEQAAEQTDEPFRWDADDEPEPVTTRRRPQRGEQEAQGLGEEIYERIMDSRYGAQPNQTRESSTTLLEEMAKLDLEFSPASGGAFAEEEKVHWIDLINDLLDYDEPKEGEAIDPLRAPRLYISEECPNLLFALQNWTGEDGKTGACKDPIDVLKYLVLADTEDYSAGHGKEAA